MEEKEKLNKDLFNLEQEHQNLQDDYASREQVIFNILYHYLDISFKQ